jgi:membrane associated rhomboid family serine protease
MLYVLSGIGGSLLSALFMQGSISVGASGALFGLLGSMLSELLTNWTIYEKKVLISTPYFLGISNCHFSLSLTWLPAKITHLFDLNLSPSSLL